MYCLTAVCLFQLKSIIKVSEETNRKLVVSYKWSIVTNPLRISYGLTISEI